MELAFALWIASLVVAPIVARHKGRSALGWGLLGFCLGPVALLVCLLPSTEAQDARNAHTYGSWGDWRLCPHCAESVRKAASKCRYCQSDLVPGLQP